MDYAFDVPGYLQGYRFSDADPAFYDAATKTFHDQAGYGPKAGLSITTGTPTFDTVDDHRGLKMDNTAHGSFKMPIQWQGSMIVVVKPDFLTSGTHSIYPLLFGDSASVSSNGRLQLAHASGNRTLSLITNGSGASANHVQSDDLWRVFGAAMDQETRKSYSTPDGVTITEAAATASSTTGNAPSLKSATVGCRFGKIKGISGDVTTETDLICRMYELHFFAGNVWTDHLTEAAAFMASLRTKYGVT